MGLIPRCLRRGGFISCNASLGVQDLLSPDELKSLQRSHRKGRVGLGHHVAQARLAPGNDEADATLAAGKREPPQGHPGHQRRSQPGHRQQALAYRGNNRATNEEPWEVGHILYPGQGFDGRALGHRQNDHRGKGEAVQGRQAEKTGSKEERMQEERVGRAEAIPEREGTGGAPQGGIPA